MNGNLIHSQLQCNHGFLDTHSSEEHKQEVKKAVLDSMAGKRPVLPDKRDDSEIQLLNQMQKKQDEQVKQRLEEVNNRLKDVEIKQKAEEKKRKGWFRQISPRASAKTKGVSKNKKTEEDILRDMLVKAEAKAKAEINGQSQVQTPSTATPCDSSEASSLQSRGSSEALAEDPFCWLFGFGCCRSSKTSDDFAGDIPAQAV